MARRRASPPPASFNSSSSSRNGNANSGRSRRPLPGSPASRGAGSAARGMATAPVTCRVCGCLNFSSLDLCDACRLDIRSPTSAAAASPPSSSLSSNARSGLQFVARRSSPWSSYNNSARSSTGDARRADSADDPGRPRAAKRSRNKGQEQQGGGGETHQHEVIDLVSDGEEEDQPMPRRGGDGEDAQAREDGVLQAGHADSDQPPAATSDPPSSSSITAASAGRDAGVVVIDDEEKPLFMSRVFAAVSYDAADFPTDAEANATRRDRAQRAAAAVAAAKAELASSSATPAATSAATSLPLTVAESSSATIESKREVILTTGAARRPSSPPASVGQETAVSAQSTSSPLSSTQAGRTVPSAPSPLAEVVPEAMATAAASSQSALAAPLAPSPEPELQQPAVTKRPIDAVEPPTPAAAPPLPVPSEPAAISVASSTAEPESSNVDDEEEEATEADGSPWMSRVFEPVTFDNDDFVTKLEGLPAARRSHPPRPHPQPVNEGTVTAPPSDAASASSPANDRSEPPSTTTTASPSVGASPRVVPPTATTTHVVPVNQPATSMAGVSTAVSTSPQRASAASSHEPPSPQVKLEPPALVPFYRQVQKPSALGECSAEFLMFVKECGGESYVEDDEEWRQQQLQMLDVVDMTNLSDSEGEGADDSDSDFVILGDSRSGYVVALTQTNGLSIVNGFGTSSTGSAPSAVSAVPATGPPVASVLGATPAAPKPAAPVLAECMLCSARRSIRTMAQCPKCSQYYHTRCARDYGGAVRCWECEPDEFIDDSDLTEAVHEETVSMLRVFRQDPFSPSDEDAGEGEGDGEQVEGEEEGGGQKGAEDQGDGNEDQEMEDVDAFGDDNPLMSGRPTRTEWRWSTFVNDATASLESQFREVTERIEREMATSEGRARYSKGFATRESFNASMNSVVNRYVELERERARAQAQAQVQAQVQAQAMAQAQAQALAQVAMAQAQASAPGSVGTGDAAATATAPAADGDASGQLHAASGGHAPSAS